MHARAVVAAALARARRRSALTWGCLGLVSGPIAPVLLWLLPARPAPLPPPVPTIADEIWALEEMRQRGILTDAEFATGKAKLLAGDG